MQDQPNVPYGYCHCGCGQRTTLAVQNHTRLGYVKDEPLRYVLGHNGRRRERHRVEDRGYSSPCWTWLLVCHKATGYGQVRVGAKKKYAHRVYYEQHMGPIPEGLELDHLCRNRNCVNPDHLEPVTREENIRRAVAAGSWAKPRPWRRGVSQPRGY